MRKSEARKIRPYKANSAATLLQVLRSRYPFRVVWRSKGRGRGKRQKLELRRQ